MTDINRTLNSILGNWWKFFQHFYNMPQEGVEYLYMLKRQNHVKPLQTICFAKFGHFFTLNRLYRSLKTLFPLQWIYLSKSLAGNLTSYWTRSSQINSPYFPLDPIIWNPQIVRIPWQDAVGQTIPLNQIPWYWTRCLHETIPSHWIPWQETRCIQFADP